MAQDSGADMTIIIQYLAIMALILGLTAALSLILDKSLKQHTHTPSEGETRWPFWSSSPYS